MSQNTIHIGAQPTKTQEAVDRFYVEHGPCCAGCDWWHHHNSLVGECHKSAPVDAEQRYSMVRIDWHTYRFREREAGHILTNREHHCGDFRDGFNWIELPAHYLRKIGWEAPRTPAAGWCTHCGCGNDAAGYAHAPLCQRPE